MLDNEEVGSSSRQGAQGTFLADVLDRILAALAQDVQARWRLSANSLIVSADNGHAHPSQPPGKVRPGKRAGPQRRRGAQDERQPKYTTDAVSGALFESINKHLLGTRCAT